MLPIIIVGQKLKDLNNMIDSMDNTPKMPVLFLGHGSPMNAIEENDFVAGFRSISKTIPKPKAILCVSAHWETQGTLATAMEHPPTIHDFGGFPEELFKVQYPALGDPSLAQTVKALVTKTNIGLDHQWGLDHGTWSVVKHLYPNADIPIIQMSLNKKLTPQDHYELAKEIKPLREKGILIIGSGNMVHNLRILAWDKLSASEYGFDWALEANEKMKKYILNEDHESLINFRSQGRAFDLSIPTPEHYLPLLYVLALKDQNDNVTLFNEKLVAGSLSMTSIKIG